MTQSDDNNNLFRRVDASFEFGEPETTPEGYLEVPGVAATTGILEYEEPDGSVRRELVTRDALEDPSSLIGKPVTLEHPPSGEVNPQNYQQHTVGEVVDAKFDSKAGKLRVKLRIKDAEAIRAVRSGTRQLSPGYSARIEKTSGTHSEYGEYDVKQVDRQNNHLAITRAGRDGPESSIRLDSAGNVILEPHKDQSMTKQNEESEEQTEETEESRTDALEDRIDRMADQVSALTKTVQALAEAQSGSGDEGGEETTETKNDEDREDSDMDKEERLKWFEQRQDALDTADALGVDVPEGADVKDIQRAVVKDQRGDLRNDSDEYIEAAYDLITDDLDDREDREDSETGGDDLDDLNLGDFGESFMPEEPREDSQNGGNDGPGNSYLRPGEEPAQAALREQLSGNGNG